MVEFNSLHAEALYVRFCAIYGDKFYKPYHTDDFKKIWFEEWSAGLAGIDVMLIKSVLETCKLTVEWPPSIAEFRAICEKASGIPSLEQALSAAVRGDFNHPVIAIAYDKVGSWTMKNSKEVDLLPKFKSAYIEALTLFRVNPESAKNQLEAFNERKALPPPPSKIPTQEEIIGWRERLKRYQEMAKADQAKLEAKDHPKWEKTSVMVGHKNFDSKLYNERKQYLTNMDEVLASTLSNDDKYDRIRFLREDIGRRSVENYQSTMPPPQEEKVAPRSYNSPRKVWDKWND